MAGLVAVQVDIRNTRACVDGRNEIFQDESMSSRYWDLKHCSIPPPLFGAARCPQTGTESQSRCRSTGNRITRFSSPGNLSNSGMIMANTVFDLITEYALITELLPFSRDPVKIISGPSHATIFGSSVLHLG